MNSNRDISAGFSVVEIRNSRIVVVGDTCMKLQIAVLKLQVKNKIQRF